MAAQRRHPGLAFFGPRRLGGAVYALLLLALAGAALAEGGRLVPAEANTLDTSDDEVLMLFISLAVVPIIAANFRYIRKVRHVRLLLCSFGCFALSAALTVAEGFVFAETLNYGEHLLLASAAALLAVWCGRAFAAPPQEGS
ncbi:MAG: hypothetical protein L0Y36_07130 [Planctomycetales bacterium]|nr:hypothetical protein [Planctomycetales bacterium]